MNYCQWEETRDLAHQLVADPSASTRDVEVVIVDNHSSPHPAAKQLRRTRGITIRLWERNRGFARAVNEGCWLSRGDWILLLNPDITVSPTFCVDVLSLLDRLAHATPPVGIVGFQLRNTDGTRQLSTGPFPTLLSTLLGLAWPRARRKYHLLAPRHGSVPWVTGCCLLLNRACLEQLGGLDEDYFLYYEDVDLCRRARACGWSVCFEPNIEATHHRPLHSRTVTPLLRLLTRHALLTYARKHWALWQFQLLGGIVRAEAWLRQRWAAWRGDAETVEVVGRLRGVAADLAHGRPGAARQGLERAVRREERRRAG